MLEDRELLLPQSVSVQKEFKLYPQRWWNLVVFSFLTLHQSNMWITFGCVADTAMSFYDTPSNSISFLSELGPIVYLPFAPASAWAINSWGLRNSVLLAALACTAGAVLRCFATSSSFWLVILGQALNAAAGPIAMTIPPALSTAWFGVNERTFSTAVGSLANGMGSAAGFLLGLLVTDSRTLILLLYGEAAFMIALFVAILLYFPNAPPSPPSTSAALRKDPEPFLQSWLSFFKESAIVLTSVSGLLLSVIGSLFSGVYGTWAAMLVVILSPLGFSQNQTQWLGFLNSIIGLLGGLIVGKLHDHYFRRFKVILIALFILTAVSSGLFTLCTDGFVSIGFVWILVINSFAGFFSNALYPMTYEALVEVTYPVKEEYSAGMLAFLLNIFSLLFFQLGDVISAQLMNWTMPASAAVAAILCLFVKEKYLRTKLDLGF